MKPLIPVKKFRKFSVMVSADVRESTSRKIKEARGGTDIADVYEQTVLGSAQGRICSRAKIEVDDIITMGRWIAK